MPVFLKTWTTFNFAHDDPKKIHIYVNFKGLKLAMENLVWFSSPTASGAILRGKYQHFALDQLFETSRPHNSVYNYEKKVWEILILRGQNWLGRQKIQFLLQLSSNVNRNTVWK